MGKVGQGGEDFKVAAAGGTRKKRKEQRQEVEK